MCIRDRYRKYNTNSEKIRLLFFGHLYRMDDNRLTKQIFKYLWGKKSTLSWIKEIQKDLEKKNKLDEKFFSS